MNEISCEICMDLIPLVRDGAASGDSREAVEQHILQCPSCRALWEGEKQPEEKENRALSRAIKKVQTLSMVVWGTAVLVGIVVCECIMQGSSIFFLGTVWLTGKLLRIAAAKEKNTLGRTAALLAAVGLLTGIGWLANEVLGNPVEKSRAEKQTLAYLEENYPELALDIGEISYVSSSSAYDVQVIARADTEFTVVYRRGEILYDTYGED